MLLADSPEQASLHPVERADLLVVKFSAAKPVGATLPLFLFLFEGNRNLDLIFDSDSFFFLLHRPTLLMSTFCGHLAGGLKGQGPLI